MKMRRRKPGAQQVTFEDLLAASSIGQPPDPDDPELVTAPSQPDPMLFKPEPGACTREYTRDGLSGAVFAGDDIGGELYTASHRLLLWRFDQELGARALWIMLNPSTAGGKDDDATIRRCRTFTRAFGCTGFYVCNLYSVIATDPEDLWKTEPEDRNHERALDYLTEALDKTIGPIVVAWGALPIPARSRADEMRALLRERGRTSYCLDKTNGGYPKHPVRLPNGLTLQTYDECVI